MSVALLSRSKSVEICDELEAFLYVLIYYAARYLRSDCDGATIAIFLDEFFDTFGIDNGRYVCGATKLRAIEKGTLTIGDSKLLTFDRAVDSILQTLLSWFSAHHLVTSFERMQETKRTLKPFPLLPTATPSTAPSPSDDVDDDDDGEDDDEDEDEDKDDGLDKNVSVELPDQNPEPSPKQRRLAAMVHDHQNTLKVLIDMIKQPKEWTAARVPDMVPAGIRLPDKSFGPTLQSALGITSGRAKKARLTGVASAPLLLTRPRPPITPPRAGKGTWLGK